MRLIDADALKPLLREYCVDDDEVVMKWYDIMGVDEVVDRAPTVDAVPVVRCKDCKWKADTIGESWCDFHEFTILSDDDYCSHGERKDDEKL